MHRPWLTPIIIIFWCVTTTWLVVAKILPSLLPGSPPGYQALYASNNRLIPVAWGVLWKDQPLGWAVSESVRDDDGGVGVETILHFERLPIDELLPGWMKTLVGRALDGSVVFDFEARSTLSIDAEGVAADGTIFVSYLAHNTTLAGVTGAATGVKLARSRTPYPTSAADWELFVVDASNFMVHVFDLEAACGVAQGVSCLRSLGCRGNDPGELEFPWGVAADPNCDRILIGEGAAARSSAATYIGTSGWCC